MVLNMSKRSMVVPCLKMEIISKAYIMLICLSIMGKEFVLLFLLFVMLFVLWVIVLCGNFATCFFQSNDKWEYAFNTNIFISNFTFYYFLTQSYFFSYNYILHTSFTDSQNNLFSFILIIVTLLASVYDE